ncbi:MAG: virulence RhuM family protein [Muribaculaceae bacterium]|nr:virulence RhuM family protein [Muribaculaceae bacterium]
MNSANEIILYQPDDTLCLNVRVEDESVWLSQAQMAELFLATKQNVSLHIRNIFKEGELDEKATVKEYLTVQKEGKRDVQRKISYYNLDVIISVGYRVKSLRGTQFRQWANKILKEYLLRGYSINQRLMLLEDRIDRRFSEYDRHLL